MVPKLEEHRNAKQSSQAGMLQHTPVARYSVMQEWSQTLKPLAVSFASQIMSALKKESLARNVLNTLLRTRITLSVFHMI